MKLTFRNTIAVFIFGITFHMAEAQSLSSFIEKALEDNYQLKIVKNEAIIASNNNTPGNAGQMPTVDFNGSASSSLNNTLQQFADGTERSGTNALNSNVNMSLLANWTLFNGFSVVANKSKLEYLEEMGELNTKFYIEQTVSDIALVYYQLWYENRILENYTRSLEISRFRLKIEEEKHRIGSSTGMAYRQALVDYQADSINSIAQQNSIKLLEIELNRILNNELEITYTLKDTALPLLPIEGKEALMSTAKSQSKQLEQQRLNELVIETEARLARADRYPTVQLFGGYQYSKSLSEVGFFTSNRNSGPVIGIQVGFNLYNGGKTNLQVKNSNVWMDNATVTTAQLRQTLDADMLGLLYRYETVNAQIILAKDNVKNMEKVYAIAAEQMKKGVINGYDFRLNQLTLLSAQLTLMQLQYTLKTLEININRLTGNALVYAAE